MSRSASLERGSSRLLRQRIGGGILIIGSGLTLFSLFWLPFKSEFAIRGTDGVALQRLQSLTEWQYALNWFDASAIFLTPFVLLVLLMVLALLYGVLEVLGIGMARRGSTLTRLFFFLLILALLAQCFDVWVSTLTGVGDRGCVGQPFCTGTYTAWRGDYGIMVSFVGMACVFVGFIMTLPERLWEKYFVYFDR